jgi:hypothetical protein
MQTAVVKHQLPMSRSPRLRLTVRTLGVKPKFGSDGESKDQAGCENVIISVFGKFEHRVHNCGGLWFN